MVRTWHYTENKRKIMILRKYENLLIKRKGKKRITPKQAWDIISREFDIRSRKTIYNWKEAFKNIPLGQL